MCYAYWKSRMDNREAVFHLFFRKPPFKGGFTVAAGLEQVVHFLEEFKFSESDLSYLEMLPGEKGKPYFEKPFLEYLSRLKFTCDVDAVPEGTIVFPYEPLLRIQGPMLQCQLLESLLLNFLNFPSLIATKAARVCIAANGDPVMEFGLRRAQGINGALTASRSAYIGGCDATSNVMAGKLFGIPVRGTHSHSWVMAFEDEIESFRTYAEALPNHCVFLVDTYNTMEGVKRAIAVGQTMREKGHELLGVRLDSGDLAHLSIAARRLLDEAGFENAQIYASNELDETIISELKRQGAKISAWGVGTNLVTAKDQPALDGVYKLSALKNSAGKWEYKLKLSEQMLKISNPGILQVRRFSKGGYYVADAIYDIENRPLSEWRVVDLFDSTKELIIRGKMEECDLLVPLFRNGKLVYTLPSLKEIRAKLKEELDRFPVGIKRFLNPHQFPVGMEWEIHLEKMRLIREIREKNGLSFVPEGNI